MSFVPSIFSLFSSATFAAVSAFDMRSSRVYGDVGADPSSDSHVPDLKNPSTTDTAHIAAAPTDSLPPTTKKRKPRVIDRIASEKVVDESTGVESSLFNASFLSYLQTYVQSAKRDHHMPDDVYEALCISTSVQKWPAYLRNHNTTKTPEELENLIKTVQQHRSKYFYRVEQDTRWAQIVTTLERCPLRIDANTRVHTDFNIVVKLSDAEARISDAHRSTGHQGHDNTWEMLVNPPNGGRRYDCLVRDWIREYVRRCPFCQSKAPKTNKNPLTPIISNGIMERIQLDAIDFRSSPFGEFKWIFYAVDHFSKFHWVILEAWQKRMDDSVF
jgi:hypothetical protein